MKPRDVSWMRSWHRISLAVIALVCAGSTAAQPTVNARQDRPAIEKGQFLPVPVLEKDHPTITPDTVVELFSEDFESGAPGWTTTGSWAVGSPNSGPQSGYQSPNAAATNLDGPYGNGADDWLISPPINLIPGTLPTEFSVRFDEWFATESGLDLGTVEVTTDGGSTWTTLDTRDGTSDWRSRTISLTAYANQTIQLGFRLQTDGSVVNDGWYIDNVTVISDEMDPVGVSIPSINAQRFPFIFMDVVAEDNVGDCPDELNASHFAVEEDAVPQTDFLTVIPPSQGGGSRLVDIVFLIDNSGSMSGEQQQVIDNIEDFVDKLAAEGVDFALCLTRYGQSSGSGDPILEDAGSCTSDVGYFKTGVLTRNVAAGSREPGYFAITESAAGVTFRPGASRIFIEITDESPNQGGATLEEADAALDAGSVTLFALTLSSLAQYYEPLVDDPDKQIFDIVEPFDGVLEFIGTIITDTYRVSYRTSNDQKDGTVRMVTTTVTCGPSSGQGQTSYQVGAAPQIERTQATIDLSTTPQVESQPLPIEVIVTDTVEPLVQEVNLFYKPTTDASFTKVVMAPGAMPNSFVADIPGTSVLTPGVDYYLTASDGDSTSSLPSTSPAANPFQIAVLPNEAPVIEHTPVLESPVDTDIPIDAKVTDTTNTLAEVSLLYRQFGTLTYGELPMAPSGGDNYSATIPAVDVTAAGVEYYLRAVDDFGVSTTFGSPDEPLFIEGIVLPDCDLNGDGQFTRADLARFAVFCALEQATFECDIDGSGEFSIADVFAFRNACLQKQK